MPRVQLAQARSEHRPRGTSRIHRPLVGCTVYTSREPRDHHTPFLDRVTPEKIGRPASLEGGMPCTHHRDEETGFLWFQISNIVKKEGRVKSLSMQGKKELLSPSHTRRYP